MDYMREINAFERWNETNYLPCLSQLLWYRLMALCNRAGWPEWVAVDNQRLMGTIQCERKATLIALRDKLIENRLVEFRKGKKGSPNQYRMIPFGFTGVPKEVPKSVLNTGLKSVPETVHISSYPSDTQKTYTNTKTKTNTGTSRARACDSASGDEAGQGGTWPKHVHSLISHFPFPIFNLHRAAETSSAICARRASSVSNRRSARSIA